MYYLIYGILIISILLYIYYIQFYRIKCQEQIFIDDVIAENKLRTGDMLLFKAYDNFNSIITTCYYGHVGIVYIENGIPMLFEANATEGKHLMPHHNKRGIYLTPVETRVKKYKGRCFIKRLSQELTDEQIVNLKAFIDYSLENLAYEHSVVKSFFKKILRTELCDKNTNCGEITFLAMIVMGLLPIEQYDQYIAHHLKFVCYTDTGYEPNEALIEIIDHPYHD